MKKGQYITLRVEGQYYPGGQPIVHTGQIEDVIGNWFSIKSVTFEGSQVKVLVQDEEDSSLLWSGDKDMGGQSFKVLQVGNTFR